VSLDKTIDALLPDWPPLAPSARAQVSAHCVAFVRAQLKLAPFHIRAGFQLLFTAYVFFALLRVGPFPSRAARARSLTAFSALPLPMMNGVERVLRAATMLAYFDEPLVLAALGEDTPATRQQKVRAIREAAP
jgi:hypothetical protein